MSKPEDSPYICWIDLETTGNKPTDLIIEIGAVMTDRNLNEFGFQSIPVWVDPEWSQWVNMDPFVRDMHTKNGLIHDVETKGEKIWEADNLMVEWIRQFTKGDHIPLAGSGVSHFDRHYIQKDLPNFEEYLSYWSYDVGTFRRILKLFGFDIADRKTNLNHRALDDIRDHIEEMRSYKDQVGLAKEHYGFTGFTGPEHFIISHLDSSGAPI